MSRMPESPGRRPRRQFDNGFKAQAVRLVLDEGKSVGAVARDLDLTESALRQWVEHARADRSGGRTGLTTAERDELARLRKENRVLRMEHEILGNHRARLVPRSLLDQKLQDGYRRSTPGGVAVCFLVTPRTRKKTWSGGGLRT